MPFAIDVFGNIIASVAAWLFLGLAFLMLGRKSRKRFMEFFNLNEHIGISVFLSNIWTTDLPLLYARRSPGYIVSKHEFLAARSIDSLLGSAPTRLPEIVRGLVDAFWLHHRVQCDIEVSPPTIDGLITPGTLIIVGASLRNSLRRHFADRNIPTARIAHVAAESADDEPDAVHEITVQNTSGGSQVIRSRLNLAVVEKVHTTDSDRIVFFCCGIRADATWGAVEYLARNWKVLESEFGNHAFVVCLGFQKVDPYAEVYSEPEVLSHIRQ